MLKTKIFDLIVVIVCIIIIFICAVTIHKQRECQVLYDGGHFVIVSYNGAEYIINKDIYGGGIYKK